MGLKLHWLYAGTCIYLKVGWLELTSYVTVTAKVTPGPRLSSVEETLVGGGNHQQRLITDNYPTYRQRWKAVVLKSGTITTHNHIPMKNISKS